jgi:hypothetical protein
VDATPSAEPSQLTIGREPAMTSGGSDLVALVREAVQAARAAGLNEAADELESRTSAAFTTSSEWLGEVGLAIRQFRARERGRLPPAVQRSLDSCLAEVRKVWPRLG